MALAQLAQFAQLAELVSTAAWVPKNTQPRFANDSESCEYVGSFKSRCIVDASVHYIMEIPYNTDPNLIPTGNATCSHGGAVYYARTKERWREIRARISRLVLDDHPPTPRNVKLSPISVLVTGEAKFFHFLILRTQRQLLADGSSLLYERWPNHGSVRRWRLLKRTVGDHGHPWTEHR